MPTLLFSSCICGIKLTVKITLAKFLVCFVTATLEAGSVGLVRYDRMLPIG